MPERLSYFHGAEAARADISLLRTRDGSFTLYSQGLDERFHSVHGAVQESFHVFLRMGYMTVAASPLRVLEVGLGSGLNLLLTWVEADLDERNVAYTALEPHPLPADTLLAMDHAGAIGLPERTAQFLSLMAQPEGAVSEPSAHFTFQWLSTRVQDLDRREAYDLVYFDAFGPANQPEMWSLEVFERLFKALAPGGVLVTYCAKGAVRRTMQAAGFTVERVQGPVGKKEMLRATKRIP